MDSARERLDDPRSYDYSHVTMDKKLRRVPAGEFKARCLALLDDVAERGEMLVVTKHGKPVAKVVPIEPSKKTLLGSIVRETDLVSPIQAEWDADS